MLNRPAAIKIVPGVLGVVAVMGYSGIAKQSIKELEQKDSSIKVIPLFNELDVNALN